MMVMGAIRKRLFKRNNFWHYANFDEISKLYVSKTLRHFALRLVAIFVAIYLYNLGYSLVFVFGYMAIYHFIKMLMLFFTAKIVLRLGAKRSIFYANILYIPTILGLTLLGPAGQAGNLLLLAGILLVQAASVSLYDYSNSINFAKIKNYKKAGKELGNIQVMEKAASIAGPIAGGIIATVWGPEVVMVIAAIIMGIAALPLLRMVEPINHRSRLRWRRYPWKKTWPSLLAQTGVGFDIMVSGVAWQLYLATIVFSLNDEIYSVVGILTSISTIMAFVAAFIFGRLADSRAGKWLIHLGVYLKSFTHLMRAGVGTPVAAASIGAVSEVASTSYSMAFMRGTYDLADHLEYRVNYLLLMSVIADLGATIACSVAIILLTALSVTAAFMGIFTLAAVYILIINKAEFPIYK